jgi:hypothetical protein
MTVAGIGIFDKSEGFDGDSSSFERPYGRCFRCSRESTVLTVVIIVFGW